MSRGEPCDRCEGYSDVLYWPKVTNGLCSMCIEIVVTVSRSGLSENGAVWRATYSAHALERDVYGDTPAAALRNLADAIDAS